MITLDEYAGPYRNHRDFNDIENLESACTLVNAVAEVMVLAAAEVEFVQNPATHSFIAGNGNGGFRPQESRVGARASKHKLGQAVDIYDPHRQFARWCLRNQDILIAHRLHAMEDPRWTPSWVHLQTQPVASGNFVFIPNSSPPLASALPEQLA